MKFVVVLSCLASILIFSCVTFASADELQDLKVQIKELQATVQALAEKVENLEAQKNTVAAPAEPGEEGAAAGESTEKGSSEKSQEEELGGEVSDTWGKVTDDLGVGGHLKMFVLDQSQGERNGDQQKNTISAGINDFYLYIRKELGDILSIDVEIEDAISASATPTLGSNITRATTATNTVSLYQAYMTVRLPWEVEARAGMFHPMFSEEYAKETWWDEQYHQNQGLAYLQSWRDTGIELYKSFDFEKFSIPTYLYLLNGNITRNGEAVDNNQEKSFLIHTAPEFFNGQLRFPLSFARGEWDNAGKDLMVRYAGGFDWNWKKIGVSGEYLYNEYDNVALLPAGNEAPGVRQGYYLKSMYRFDEKWRIVAKYSHSDLYATGAPTMRTDTYDAITLTLNYFIWGSSIIMPSISYVDANRSDDSEELQYLRYTLGWRTTF